MSEEFTPLEPGLANHPDLRRVLSPPSPISVADRLLPRRRFAEPIDPEGRDRQVGFP
jgi:hypothetical protein